MKSNYGKIVWDPIFNNNPITLQAPGICRASAVSAGMNATAVMRVDGLSGATLTSRGIDNMLRYRLGEQGLRPFLKNLRQGDA